ncbi:MAG: BrxA family protein, partial [Candidatus Paceibacterota bacterium]
MKYRFSFTASSAMLPEFIRIGELVYKGESINDINQEVLGREKGATNKRQFNELKKRIESLTAEQIEILAEGNIDEQ